MEVYKGKTVFITGHTGFKGSWLSLWLHSLGAFVTGYSLLPPTEPNLYTLCDIGSIVKDMTGDVRDYDHLLKAMEEAQPEIVFHLAAQPLVLHSYSEPKETFDVNVGGTVNVLEAVRHCPSVQAVVIVTTDKCYENNEWLWGYRENDRLGGHDPYSASKCMAEHAVTAYRQSFFNDGKVLIASVRAGNVIGGGDFSSNRIIPDVIRSLREEIPVNVRNPHSIRPWLHVLDCLNGYLTVGASLLQCEQSAAQAWNFGPLEQQGIPVQSIVEKAIECWGSGSWNSSQIACSKPEMHSLRLNWDKAASLLDWHPQYRWDEAVKKTIEWYQVYAESPASHHLREYTLQQIQYYTDNVPGGSSCVSSQHL